MLALSCTGQVWAGSSNNAYITAATSSTGSGLVYIANNGSNKAVPAGPSSYTQYKDTLESGMEAGTDTKGVENPNGANGDQYRFPAHFYVWAMPARGFLFQKWSGKGWSVTETDNQATPSTVCPNKCSYCMSFTDHNTGQGDHYMVIPGRLQSVGGTLTAAWTPDASYRVIYEQPVGGEYTASYLYYETEGSGSSCAMKRRVQTLQLTPTSGDLKPTGVVDGNTVDWSYARDTITLTCTDAGNTFVGWYETPTDVSGAITGSPVLLTHQQSGNVYTCSYTPNQNARISARFKSLTLGQAVGDLTIDEHDKDSTYTKQIKIPVSDIVGTWTAADFTAAFGPVTGDADFTVGTLQYANDTLTIPFAYKANSWTGSSVQLTVTALTSTLTVDISATATQLSDQEACLEVNGITTQQGTLVNMVAAANLLDSKPTVRLLNNVTNLTAALSLQKSMTLDLNDKAVTGTTANIISLDAEDIEVKVVDNGFNGTGAIRAQTATNDVVSAVRFTQKAKLTLQKGTISAQNTADITTNPNARAYGILVQGGSNFRMTGGDLTVVSDQQATGIYVATAGDYATVDAGRITVNGKTQSYGIQSQGQTNITGTSVNVTATTGAGAYGIYVANGITTATDVVLSATAQTTDAHGAYVEAGKLNYNGGSLTVQAAGQQVYGIQVQAGATAVLQQRAAVTATSTGTTGTQVYGVQNLGTAKLYNANVSATSPTNQAYAVNSATGATATEIEGGTYSATTTTGYAYGLNHQGGSLEVDGGTFTALATNGSNVYGARATVDATIQNATLRAEAQGSGKTAYGFVGDAEGATISLTGCTLEAISATSVAQAVRTQANTTLTNCTLLATAMGTEDATGFYAQKGQNTLVNTSATVSANTTKAYGIRHMGGTLSATGGTFTVTAKQTTATAAGSASAYGLLNAKGYSATLNQVSFIVRATNNSYAQAIYGAYVSGTLQSTACHYDVQTRRAVYGLWGDGTSSLTSDGDTIEVSATIADVAYGIYSNKNFSIKNDLILATATTTTAYALNLDGKAVGTVESGKYKASAGTSGFGPVTRNGSAASVQFTGGYYSTSANLQYYTPTTHHVYTLASTSAEYAEGYWYEISTENPTSAVCRIGTTEYARLEDALEYANNNTDQKVLIIMLQPYTLPAGNYVLPQKATLLVPYTSTQTSIRGAIPWRRHTVGELDENLLLTFATGVNMNVSGAIEVGAEQYIYDGGKIARVQGPYSRIQLEEGSSIVLNSGSRLYAWGFITGTGTITAKRNSYVYEMFQIMDMPSAGNLVDHYLASAQSCNPKAFPITQYYIQNIEAPATYYYDSHLIGSMAIYHPTMGTVAANTVKIIGTNDCLFQITADNEATWVRKSYDAVNDRQVWDVNSSAELGSLIISMSGYEMNSREYVLPVTSNMTIHVLDGYFGITQDAEVLPGAVIEVNKTASLNIDPGKKVYLMDLETNGSTSLSKVVKNPYSPSWAKGVCPRSSTIDPATINLHGCMNIGDSSRLFTTTTGAAVISTNADAGTVNFASANDSDAMVYYTTSYSPYQVGFPVNPAKLKNGSSASQPYTSTAGVTGGDAFVYINDMWQETYVNGCFFVQGATVYAKPAEYVALLKTQDDGTGHLIGVENANHTYTTVDGHLLILQPASCQWWEVTQDPDDTTLFYCAKEGYEGYYYYDNGDWKLKKVYVTFYANEERTVLIHDPIETNYKGIPDQSVISTNPTKVEDAAGSYQFYGWKSSRTDIIYPYSATLERAAGNMYYTPVFTYVPRKYTVTFYDANNGKALLVETEYNTVPSCTPVKAPDAKFSYTFKHWLSADSSTTYASCADMPVVTGRVSYIAQWDSTLNHYSITWKNEENIIEIDTDQPYGTATAYNGALPTKVQTDQYAYTFDGWTSSLDGLVYANGATPMVSGQTTYTAHYTLTPRYTITFLNYDGTQLARTVYTQGATPAYDGTPARRRDADGYFVFSGWKNTNGDFYTDASLPVVTGKETYTAQYTYTNDLYLITLNNVDGQGTSWSGKFGVGSTPFYNPNDDDVPVTPSKAGDEHYQYSFLGWQPTMVPVSGPATYTAVFSEAEPVPYTLSFNANGHGTAPAAQTVGYGTLATEPVALCVVGYDFGGWYTEAECIHPWDFSTNTMPAQAQTLYAKWTAHTYTVTFAPGEGSGSMANQTFAYNESKALTTNAFTGPSFNVTFSENFTGGQTTTQTAGSTFKYWSGNGTTYRDGQTLLNLSEENGTVIALTAQWNTGSIVLPTPAAREGYDFMGWYDDETLGACMGSAGSAYTPSADITLYAHWRLQDAPECHYIISVQSADSAKGTVSIKTVHN